MMFSIGLKCQDNLHNYIIGKWEFKLNVKEVIKNSNELSGLEKIAARAFSGVIEKTLDETKILFDFKENKTVAIIVFIELFENYFFFQTKTVIKLLK